MRMADPKEKDRRQKRSETGEVQKHHENGHERNRSDHVLDKGGLGARKNLANCLDHIVIPCVIAFVATLFPYP
jgi:hypothetical protein